MSSWICSGELEINGDGENFFLSQRIFPEAARSAADRNCTEWPRTPWVHYFWRKCVFVADLRGILLKHTCHDFGNERRKTPRKPTKHHETPRNPTNLHECWILRKNTTHESPRMSHESPRMSHESPRIPTNLHESPQIPTNLHEPPRISTNLHEFQKIMDLWVRTQLLVNWLSQLFCAGGVC